MTIALPAHLDTSMEDAVEGDCVTAGSEPPCVLVVDDDNDIRDLVQAVLEMHGYRVDQAASASALRIRAGAPPALILLDLMMPVVDGYEIGRRLRADPATAPIPIVIMSAGTRAAAAATELRAEGYLAKPFDLARLVATVAAHVRPPLP
jgi:DNA-binding response OmpR family regulator